MEPLSWPLFRGKVNVDFMDRAACSSWMVQPNLSCWPIALLCQWPSKKWWYHSHYLAYSYHSPFFSSLFMFLLDIPPAWFSTIHICAAGLWAASDGRESVPPTARGSQQGGEEEREEARWAAVADFFKHFVLEKWQQLFQMTLTTVVCAHESPTLPSRRRRRRRRRNTVGLVSGGTRRGIPWSGTGLREVTSRTVSRCHNLGPAWFSAPQGWTCRHLRITRTQSTQGSGRDPRTVDLRAASTTEEVG